MKEVLSQNEIRYLYVDICESVGKLKLFLALRDTAPALEEVRQTHRAGIPCLVIDDEVFLPDGPEMVQELIDRYHLKG